MTAILTVLIVIMFSLIATRAATIALTATGMSRESARFQSRSAFTGAGFTTSESETVVGHPVRRRIIMWLMLAGNAGIIAVLASVVITAVEANDDFNVLVRVAAILVGIVLLWLVFQSRWVDRRITTMTMAALRRWTDLDAHDYATLLHVGGEYGVTELQVREDDWLAGRSLRDLALRDEGVILLGIERQDGTYFGVPNADTTIRPLDILVLYSRRETVAELDRRRRGGSGDASHKAAVREQARLVAEERSEEASRAPE